MAARENLVETFFLLLLANLTPCSSNRRGRDAPEYGQLELMVQYKFGQTVPRNPPELQRSFSGAPKVLTLMSRAWLGDSMAALIEDYALLSDLQTGPLVSRDRRVDWLCFPRFDSPSVFSSLVGSDDHGRWLLAPVEPRQLDVRAIVAKATDPPVWRNITLALKKGEGPAPELPAGPNVGDL